MTRFWGSIIYLKIIISILYYKIHKAPFILITQLISVMILVHGLMFR